MKCRFALIFIIVCCLAVDALADYKSLTRKGNRAYGDGEFAEALKLYKEAEIEKPQQPELDYNIGSALHQQAKYEEAVQRYGAALHSDEPELQADA
jgi:Ca-activated chloride channel family protein